ncbi:HEPN domain-containing protein, partial [Niastella vici]|uniref:HEPN domain-containing protein n=1 Tax=Niastella vici TaxID=1703345 RepID=UPI001C1F48BE
RLPRIRELLWEFFKTTVIGNYTHDLHRRDRELLVTIYEKIEKLVEAAHIINEKQKQSKKLVFETYPFLAENINSVSVARQCGTYQVDAVLQENVNSMIETIIRVTNAEKLFWSGFSINSRNRPQFDFLVLLPPNAKYSYSDYLTQVQAKYSEIGSVLIWCNKINVVYKHFREGHIFYSAACSADLMVYDNKRVTLPEKPDVDISTIKVNARNIFDDTFQNAKYFLDGAEYFATNGQYKPAAFLLHQATEHALRALLVSLTGLTAYGHNLKSLIRHSCFCAPDLDIIFPKNTDEEMELFDLLNTAYVSARYSPQYEISQDQVMMLLDRVNAILAQTEQSFEERLKTFENLILSENR